LLVTDFDLGVRVAGARSDSLQFAPVRSSSSGCHAANVQVEHVGGRGRTGGPEWRTVRPVAREPATGTQTRQALHRTEPAVSTPVLSLDIDAPPIYVDGGNLYISNFIETDAAVVRVIGEAEDRAAALHRILALGAHVSQVTTETASKLDLSNTIEQLTSSVEQTVDVSNRGTRGRSRCGAR
jgi:hypothetical protein